MVQSTFAESPVLAATVAVLAALFVLLLLGAVLLGRRDRTRRTKDRREPDFDAAPLAADDPMADGSGFPPPAPRAVLMAVPPDRGRRRGFGLAALSLAFLLGALAGAATMLTARPQIAAALARLAAAVEADDHTPPGGAREAHAAGSAPAAAAVPSPADVAARLAAFAASLRSGLPRPAGPDMALERVTVDGRRLDLGYGIARVLAPGEMEPFLAYLDRTARSLFCDDGASEVRYLSRNGVVFHMTYTDAAGGKVTEVTVAPEYCG